MADQRKEDQRKIRTSPHKPLSGEEPQRQKKTTVDKDADPETPELGETKSEPILSSLRDYIHPSLEDPTQKHPQLSPGAEFERKATLRVNAELWAAIAGNDGTLPTVPLTRKVLNDLEASVRSIAGNETVAISDNKLNTHSMGGLGSFSAKAVAEDAIRQEIKSHAVTLLSRIGVAPAQVAAHLRAIAAELEQGASAIQPPAENTSQTLPLPTTPPKDWGGRRDSGTDPASFIEEHYGTWLGKGLTQAHLLHLDPLLYRDYTRQKSDGDLPPGFAERLPKKGAENDRKLKASGHMVDGKIVKPIKLSGEAKREKNLQSAAYRRSVPKPHKRVTKPEM